VGGVARDVGGGRREVFGEGGLVEVGGDDFAAFGNEELGCCEAEAGCCAWKTERRVSGCMEFGGTVDRGREE